MTTVDEIKKLKQHYKEIYQSVRGEQETDKSYIDDTFGADIKEPHRTFRSGIGRRMVDAPAEQIVTSNLQFFIEMLKGKTEAEERISKVVNQQWIPLIACQNPNPPKETVKNKLARGESYINPRHNELWVTGKKTQVGLPVHFLVPEPMVIYGSPEEDERGIPERVIVFYERQPLDVIVRYPRWINPKGAGEGKNKDKKVEWFEYWDKDSKYFEADGEVVTKGVEPNLYGFVPFVRKYTGFGKRSPDGDLKHLIVSDIRFSRHLIYEECGLRSDIASICHLFAHKSRTFVAPEGIEPGVVKAGLEEGLSFGAYDVNVLPHGTTKIEDIEPSVPVEILQRHRDVVAEIAQRCPFIMAGFPGGSSGRQDDLAFMKALRRYDTVVENTENEWATAIWMALKMCDGRVPTLRPKGLEKDDVKGDFRCWVKLRAPDPVEEDRLVTLGSRLLLNSEIDPITNLTQYKGYTRDEAEQIMVDILKWQVLLQSPDIRELIGLRAAEKSGMLEDLQMLRQRRRQLEMGGMAQPPPSTTQQRIAGEVKTPLGAEMPELSQESKGARASPTRYTRGGA